MPAEPMGPGSQYSYLRATRARVDADTIHIASRETYTKNVPMPTPIVQTHQKSDEDEPSLGEGDRRACHRCAGILRHLLKYRPDISSAVHEVSKTLASPGDADLRRLRRLGRYLSQTLKLGLLVRKKRAMTANNLDAHTDADWSGGSINRKSTLGRILKLGSATLREFTKGQSCQTLSSGESEYYAAVTTTAEALHPPTTSGILGNAGEASIENRFDSSPRHHPATGVPTSQAH